MTINVINKTPLLVESKNFPLELKPLSTEINKTYNEIALAVNDREISLYATNKPVLTGEKWFLDKTKAQSIRESYVFTSTSNIAHGINFDTVIYISNMYGNYTDGTNWYGIIPDSSNGIAQQLTFSLDPTNIIFTDNTANLTKGIIVIEYLVDV